MKMSLQVKYIGLPVVWSIGLRHSFRHCQSCAVHVCPFIVPSAASIVNIASAASSRLMLLLLLITIVVVTVVVVVTIVVDTARDGDKRR